MLKASRNSEVSTEYATGVSFSAVAIRPPASELAATNPTSDWALTLNGSSLTVSPAGPAEDGAGAVWAGSNCPPIKRAAAIAIGTRRGFIFGFAGAGVGGVKASIQHGNPH